MAAAPDNERFMNTDEIFKRLRIGFALVIGYLAGKGLGQLMGHHHSEFFVVGFGLGVILTQGGFWLLDRWKDQRR